MYDILASADKVVLSTRSNGVWIRGLSAGRWRQVSRDGEPQVFYLVAFDGAVWSAGAQGPVRLDLAAETWREVSQGLPYYAGSGSFGAAAQDDLAATADHLYFGLTQCTHDNPTLSHTGVYSLRSGEQTWKDTGLRVTPTSSGRAYLSTAEYADIQEWGPDLLWSSGDYVLSDWGGLSDGASRGSTSSVSRRICGARSLPPLAKPGTRRCKCLDLARGYWYSP